MLVGKREIPTNRTFTHEELLQFMQERWDSSTYSSIITDPSLKRYTDLYVVLPATARYKKVLPVSKVAKLLLAEEKFHQNQIHRLGQGGPGRPGAGGNRPGNRPQPSNEPSTK